MILAEKVIKKKQAQRKSSRANTAAILALFLFTVFTIYKLYSPSTLVETELSAKSQPQRQMLQGEGGK